MIVKYTCVKVQIGNDQEKEQSESNFHSKKRVGKIQIDNWVLALRKTYRKPSEQLFQIEGFK